MKEGLLAVGAMAALHIAEQTMEAELRKNAVRKDGIDQIERLPATEGCQDT